MRIYANQLNAELGKGLKPVYLVFGDEPLQKLESLDAIRALARQQGFDERLCLTVDSQFDWNELYDAFNSLSLFSSRKLIELEVDKGKVGQQGAKVLGEVSALFNPDTILVLHGSKLETSVTKAKWFKNLESQGIYLPVYNVEGEHFNRWLAQRCRAAQLHPDNDAIALLAEFYTGNLLAAAQEIDKLAVSFRGSRITAEYLQGILLNQSRFSVFQLVDELLAGRIDKALAILASLKREDMEPTIVSWALTREVLQLFEMKSELDGGAVLSDVMNRFKVWKNRQSLIGGALKRLSMPQLQSMVDALGTLDIKLKSAARSEPYTDFCHICMLFGFAEQMAPYRLSA